MDILLLAVVIPLVVGTAAGAAQAQINNRIVRAQGKNGPELDTLGFAISTGVTMALVMIFMEGYRRIRSARN